MLNTWMLSLGLLLPFASLDACLTFAILRLPWRNHNSYSGRHLRLRFVLHAFRQSPALEEHTAPESTNRVLQNCGLPGRVTCQSTDVDLVSAILSILFFSDYLMSVLCLCEARRAA